MSRARGGFDRFAAVMSAAARHGAEPVGAHRLDARPLMCGHNCGFSEYDVELVRSPAGPLCRECFEADWLECEQCGHQQLREERDRLVQQTFGVPVLDGDEDVCARCLPPLYDEEATGA